MAGVFLKSGKFEETYTLLRIMNALSRLELHCHYHGARTDARNASFPSILRRNMALPVHWSWTSICQEWDNTFLLLKLLTFVLCYVSPSELTQPFPLPARREVRMAPVMELCNVDRWQNFQSPVFLDREKTQGKTRSKKTMKQQDRQKVSNSVI